MPYSYHNSLPGVEKMESSATVAAAIRTPPYVYGRKLKLKAVFASDLS
jgi:hypothetical protein